MNSLKAGAMTLTKSKLRDHFLTEAGGPYMSYIFNFLAVAFVFAPTVTIDFAASINTLKLNEVSLNANASRNLLRAAGYAC